MPEKKHRVVPTWVIVAVGIVATGAALIWSSGLRDDHGEALLDETTAKVLVALLGAAATILGLVLQRAGDIRHQVKNSHGTNLRDDIDALSARIGRVEDTAGHAVRAARKASDDTVQLREDVQAMRGDLGGTQSDIRGMRKDLGRITDLLIKKES